jgi:hypothetical protein
VQGDWIIDAVVKLRDEGITCCGPTHEAELEWRRKINELSDKTLIPQTKSWYMDDDVPGKVREQSSFAGGRTLYSQLTRSSLDNGFEGFITV